MTTKSYSDSKRSVDPKDQSLRSLIKKGSLRDASIDVVCLLKDIAEDMRSPLASRVLSQIREKDWGGILTNSVDPTQYSDADSYFWDNQLCKLLSKYPHFPVVSEEQRSEATRANALRCELLCKDTNDFLIKWQTGRATVRPSHARIIEGARKLIDEVLGSFNPDVWLDSCRWGPGVNAFAPKSTSDYSKLTRTPVVTEEFLPYAAAFIAEFPAWVRALNPTYEVTEHDSVPVMLEVARGGKYSEVPKKAMIGRDIETQPSINGFAQRGLGVMIADRLLPYGIDLSDQSRNQELARIGSLDGSIATIDLTNASNTVSSAAVRLLIRGDWLHALEITRTTHYLIEGEWVKLHRFSSMGNGYTFELESLIFWAIARVVTDLKCNKKAPVGCFGDDIIVPTAAYKEVCDVLSVLGFTANASKSFAVGPFRESCGADWFMGSPVRPLYIKEDPHDVASLISICNGLRRASARIGDDCCHHRGFRRAWLRCVRWIPARIRRQLAYGETVDDSFLVCHRIRDGFRIIARTRTSPTTGWYGSIATALYRAYARKSVDPRLYDRERAQTLIRGLRSPLKVSSRDDTTFDLERHRHDSFVRGGLPCWG